MIECQTGWAKKWLKLDCHHPSIQVAASAAEAFCGRWFRHNPKPSLLILCGEPNCGKTHIARKVAFWAHCSAQKAYDDGGGKTWKKDLPSIVYLRWPEVVDSFRENLNSVMDDMMNAGLLVLDDVGAEYDPSQNATNKLCQVLSRREKEFTIITTNISPASWPDKFDSRICDRFFRNSEVVDLFGVPSYAFVQ
jgi:DNA replication protein DnaC